MHHRVQIHILQTQVPAKDMITEKMTNKSQFAKLDKVAGFFLACFFSTCFITTGWAIKIRSHYFSPTGTNLNFSAIFGPAAVKAYPCGYVS